MEVNLVLLKKIQAEFYDINVVQALTHARLHLDSNTEGGSDSENLHHRGKAIQVSGIYRTQLGAIDHHNILQPLSPTKGHFYIVSQSELFKIISISYYIHDGV